MFAMYWTPCEVFYVGEFILSSRQSFEDGDGVWYPHVIDNETETGLAKLSKVNKVINDRERNAKPHAFYNYFISSSYIHGPIKFSC